MVLDIRRRADRRRCRQARVWLNGREVTARCWKADGRRGHVWLYGGLDGPIRLTADRTGVYSEECRGRVRIRVGR